MTLTLEEENTLLRAQVALLEREVEFLRTHPMLVQGMKGERLVVNITGGILSAYAASHDITIGESVKIEVKFSKLNIPNPRASTKRWNWSKPLGWKDKRKDYDFLFLIGEKDLRFSEQYLDASPYVFFLLPRAAVLTVMTEGSTIGGNIQIITNLKKAKSGASLALQRHMIAEAAVNELLVASVNAPYHAFERSACQRRCRVPSSLRSLADRSTRS